MSKQSFFYQGDSESVPVGYGTPTAVGCIDCKYQSTLCIPLDEYPLETNVWQRAVLREMIQRYYDSEHKCEEYEGT